MWKLFNMKKNKERILQVILSLSVLPFWGLGLLDPVTTNYYTVFITFLGTFFAFQYLPLSQKKDKVSNLLLSIGPVFYFVFMLIKTDFSKIIIDPIFFIFILFVFTKFIYINPKIKIIISLLYTFIYIAFTTPDFY